MKKIYIDSVGCTENIIDGTIIQNIALSHGYQTTDDPEQADLIFFNSCAFKQRQEDMCIDTIERLKKIKKNGSQLVVGGCLVGINKEKLDTVFDGISFGPNELEEFYDVIDATPPKRIEEAHHIPRDISDSEMFRTRAAVEKIYGLKEFFQRKLGLRVLPNFNFFDFIGDRETVYVRISRGCQNSCGYCAIRFAQGRLVSQPYDSIIETIKDGIAQGYQKVFLIGTNTSHYGRDIGTDFFTLLEEVQKIEGEFKIIVHNYEPFGVEEDPERFIKLFSSPKMLSFYFPINSGSPTVLKGMKRNYNISNVMKAVKKLRTLQPRILIRTEFIVGYPGETWRDFFQTTKLCSYKDFNYIDLHFYSPRPNTYAAGLENQVPALIKYLRYALIHLIVFSRITIHKLRPF
jgi:tRNA A37 methylthiotransferase MiaB